MSRTAAPRRSALVALAALAASVALVLVPTAAQAHDYLVSSDPTAGTTVSTALPQLTLSFDDIVLDEGGRGALVQVTDASGRNYESGCASVSGRDVTVPVELGSPGAYRVTWQIVSADGHPVSSSIQFDYAGPSAGAGHNGPIAKCGTTVTAPAASSGAAAQTPAVSGSVIAVIIGAAAVLVLAIAAVVVLLVVSAARRRRRDDDAKGTDSTD